MEVWVGVLVIVIPILAPIALVAALHWAAKNWGKIAGIWVGGILSLVMLLATIGLCFLHQGSRQSSGWDLMGLAFMIAVTGLLFVCSALTTIRITMRY